MCCLLLASSISAKHTVVSNPTSTIFITYLVEEEGRSRRLQCGWWLLSEHAGRDQGRVPTLPVENHIRGLVQALVLHP
jgi:hypothetical protein